MDVTQNETDSGPSSFHLSSFIPDHTNLISSQPDTPSTYLPRLSTSRPRIGRCLILNYVGSGSESQSSIADQQLARINVQFLLGMFKALHFEVFPSPELNVCDTLQILKNESKYDHSNFDYFVIYIIANCSFKIRRGISEQAFYCKEDEDQDSDRINFEVLFGYFTDEYCESLAGKPKLIFIQNMGETHSNLDRLSINLPPNFLLFLTINQLYYPTLPRHSFVVQRLFYFIRRYSDMNHLHNILNKVLAHLNYPKLTTILQSTLIRPVFFNENALLNYNKLESHLHALRKLSPTDKPIKKLILLDYQNCKQASLLEYLDNFGKMHFQVHQFLNMTLVQTRNLLREESKIIKYDGTNKYSCVVFCIFANCNNQGILDRLIEYLIFIHFLKLGFTCQGNELMGLREILSCILESEVNWDLGETYGEEVKFRPLKRNSDATSTFVIINDIRAKTLDTKNVTHKPFYFISTNSNAYVSFNAYPKMNLCIDGTEFCDTILSLSTNISKKPINEEFNPILQSKLIINKGKCIILSFNLLELHHLEKAEDISEDVELLEDTFAKLGFCIESYKDFTSKQLTALIGQGFHCVDKQINLKSMLYQIDKSSPSLANIPKIIIIKNPYENKHKRENTNFHLSGIDEFHYLLPDQITIPDNFIILNCSLNNGFNESNSPFIKILCKTLKESFDRYDLMTIMRMVTLKMNDIYQDMHLKCTLKHLLFFQIEDQSPQSDGLVSKSIKRIFRSISTNLRIKFLMRGEALFYRKSNGKCIIINCKNSNDFRQNFSDNCQDIEQGIVLLGLTFEQLNFDVDKLEANSKNSLDFILRRESSVNYDNFDCLIAFIFSNDDNKNTTTREEIINYFSGNYSLVGKPKVFFVQEKLFTCKIDSDSHRRTYRIPTYADFLFFYTNQTLTTIEKLCEKLNSKLASKCDLMTLLTIVSHDIQSSHSYQYEIPYINSTMTKLVSLVNSRKISELKFDNSKLAQILPWENRGICYIFNYKDFKNRPGMVRKGTEKDVESLETTFKELNFKVKKFNNLTTQETLGEFDLISNDNYEPFECFVLCFLSHGHDNGVLHCHNGIIYRSDMIRRLNANFTLINTPKLLFIQSCQGDEEDEGVAVIEESDSDEDAQFVHHPNLFVFSSCFPGFKSYRDQTQGSWFIQSLCRIISLHKSEYDLTTIAAKVSRMVGYEKLGKKQIPFLYCTLTRPIKLASKNE